MSENTSPTNDQLFEQLAKRKRRRRVRTIVIVVLIVLAVIAALAAVVSRLRQRVLEEYNSHKQEVLAFTVTRDTLTTNVSGSGTLTQVDLTAVEVPTGVEILEVLVEAEEEVEEGQILATLNISTVLSSMASVKTQLDELDQQIASAKKDEVDPYMTAGVDGRIKELFVTEGDDIAAVMMKQGSLGTISLDGQMGVVISSGQDQGAFAELSQGDPVLVRFAEASENESSEEKLVTVDGKIELIRDSGITIVFPDAKVQPGQTVTILLKPEEKEDPEIEIGSGECYIHSPLSIIGFAGTVEKIYVKVDEKVKAGDDLMRLTNTSYSTNYDTLLRKREDLEEDLKELLDLYRDGAVLSPISGRIDSVDFSEEDSAAADASAGSYSGLQSQMMEYAGMGSYDVSDMIGSGSGEKTKIVTIDPEQSMSVTIGIDENHILALEEGQTADVKISSFDTEEVFTGVVTEVIKRASGEADIQMSGLASAFMGTAASGVTEYSATVVVDKAEGMMPGMSAEVDVHITGSENVLIVPVDAVHRTSSTYYVYTTYDEATDEYGGQVDVKIGLQNTKYIEILDGLSEGMTVYYTENEEWDFFSQFYGGRR
ncbi:MAG: hypothetical protein J5589_09625 [Firmicutes bacterium]|nr:hypothetical protein [Bacillota bacterium]